MGRFEAVLNAIRSLCFETDARALFGDFDSSMRALLVDGVKRTGDFGIANLSRSRDEFEEEESDIDPDDS